MNALFSNFKMVSLALFMAMTIVTTFLLSSFDAKAVNCDIVCPDCGRREITHFHDSKTGLIDFIFCRSCGYQWPEESESDKR